MPPQQREVSDIDELEWLLIVCDGVCSVKRRLPEDDVDADEDEDDYDVFEEEDVRKT